jgi:ATP-dependent Clp protease protease subunit
MINNKTIKATEEEPEEDEEEAIRKIVTPLKKRAILMLAGEIQEGHMSLVFELLDYHYQPDFNEPLTLLINSHGGRCDIGWAIVDTMNFVRYPINTVVIGMAASMAADIFVNGDHRTMGEHSTLMIHPHSSMSAGSHSRLLATFKGDQIENDRRLNHYLNNSKYKTIDQIQSQLIGVRGDDLYLTPQECKEHGLTDDIAYSEKRKLRESRFTSKSLGKVSRKSIQSKPKRGRPSKKS